MINLVIAFICFVGVWVVGRGDVPFMIGLSGIGAMNLVIFAVIEIKKSIDELKK